MPERNDACASSAREPKRRTATASVSQWGNLTSNEAAGDADAGSSVTGSSDVSPVSGETTAQGSSTERARVNRSATSAQLTMFQNASTQSALTFLNWR